jgi:aldose 1-epimerase
MIASKSVTELDGESIPTGRILPVESTPYDFRLSKRIGERIEEVAPGYDINYVLAMGTRELTRAAAVHDPVSGRSMEVLTTLPGIQLYTSNHVSGIRGKGGRTYDKHCALCLETQYFPDTPNQPHFPTTLLMPGKEYSAVTVLRFS